MTNPPVDTNLVSRKLANRLTPSGSQSPASPRETVEWSSGPSLRHLVSPFALKDAVPTVDAPPTDMLTQTTDTPVSETHTPWARRIGTGLALGLAGFGGLMALAPGIANAATVQSVNQVQDNYGPRITTPVYVNSSQEAKQKFDATHQLYVVLDHGQLPTYNGQKLTQADLDHFSQVLKNNPNMYVVLIAQANNLQQTRVDIESGMGNNPAFQNVVDPATGGRDGAIFEIIFQYNDPNTGSLALKSDGTPDRKIFMRTASGLDFNHPTELDQLGVGEHDWASSTDGSPGPLMNTYIQGIQAHQDPAGAMEDVFNQINTAVDNYAQQTVGTAQSNVQQAQTALTGIQPKIKQFQDKYGTGGEIGSPNVDGWKQQLKQAQDALNKKDFNTANNLSKGVVASVRTEEEAIANYEQAPQIAQQAQATLKQAQSQVGGLQSNGHTQNARNDISSAQQQLEQFNSDYKAKNPNFWKDVQGARDSANSAQSEVAASKSETQTATDVKLGGMAAATVALLTLGTVMHLRASKKGKEAGKKLDAAVAQLGEKSKELLELLNQADYQQVAGYQGKTKALADQIMSECVDALTLIGGAQKFDDEARKLVHPGGAGAIKNFFLTGNYNEALALLNGDKPLDFTLHDSNRVVMDKDSKAATWREQLEKAGTTPTYQYTLAQILQKMADNHDAASQNLNALETTQATIGKDLDAVEKTATDAQTKAQGLQQAGANDKLFTVPDVTGNLLPAVLAPADQGGLVAKGRALAGNNFISAKEDCYVPGNRMANDAEKIVEVADDGRKTLVPTVDKGDQALHPNGVKTDWAHAAQKDISDRLNDTANKALRTEVGADVNAISNDMQALETRVNTAVSQDQERREVSPKLIGDAENDVTTSRQSINDQLKKMGAFQTGTPDGVLREPKRDPSDSTQAAHQHLDAVKGSLDVGNVDQAAKDLQAVKDLSQEAHQLVADTKDALNNYPGTLSERQNRTTSTENSIATTYQPSMDRIKAGYDPKVMQQIAGEVGEDGTMANAIDEARSNIADARNQTAQAQGDFNKAYILTAKDDLNAADSSLKTAQGHLDSVTTAEKKLGDMVSSNQSELGNLQGRFGQTQAAANQSFVRSHARQLLQSAQQELSNAQQQVGKQPASPFDAKDQLGVAESARQQVDAAIQADQQAYNQAQQAISDAQGAISSANAAVQSASMQSWSFSSSEGNGSCSESVTMGDLAAAVGTIASANATLQQAESQLASQDYEGAVSTANSASSEASTASGLASAAVAAAESRFESEQASIQAADEATRERREEEEREREAEEEREREAQQQSSSSSSSSGSGGSWGGGGGGGGGGTGGSW
ncbi:MAG: hypothetical protein ACYCW6_01610 [Candidatus Xenobia bacterium]